MTTRRRLIAVMAAAAAAAGLLGSAAPASAETYSSEQLAKPKDALPDIVLGSPDAKVTIIEYASMTCSHCAHFHAATFPTLKSKYIDTGKVRFVLREFPLDPLATAGFMLARCAGDEKYYPLTDLLFDQQKNWAYTDKPLDALLQLAKQAGFTQESFETCLKNEDLYKKVNAVKDQAAEKLGVNATPTFFVNGQKVDGAISVEELDKLLTSLVGG